MRALFEIYKQQFKTTTAVMFAYRASLLIWMIGQVLEPLVYLIVWSVIANSRGNVGGFTAREFAAYYILLMLVNQVTYTWIMFDFEWRIRHGSFSFALLKPVHPIHSDIADNVTSKLITTPFMILIAGILTLFFHPSVSPAWWAIVLFFPALLLAFGIRFLLEWTVAQSAFWTTRVGAVNQIYFVLMLFLSGQFAPLNLFPAPVRAIANVLPFRWLISFPIDLISGRLALNDALIGLGAQAAWLIVMFVLMRVVWRAGVKVYSAVGA